MPEIHADYTYDNKIPLQPQQGSPKIKAISTNHLTKFTDTNILEEFKNHIIR